MTRAAHAAATDAIKKLQEIAAKTLGGNPDELSRWRTAASPGGGRSMTFAQAAQKAIELGGKYDGHELPEDINAFTKTSATALAGQGLMAVAQGQLSARRPVAVLRRRLRRSRSRRRDRRSTTILDYAAVADVGTVINPRSLQGQTFGGIDARHRPRDRPEVGLRPALRRAAGEAVPLQQAADDSRRADELHVRRRRICRIRRRRSARAASASRRSARATARC